MTKLPIWLKERRQKSTMRFCPIKLDESKEWQFRAGTLVHKTGGFFSIGGISTEDGEMAYRLVSQPIIFQPEIGILGFIVRKNSNESGAYEWLVQAKAEPGNQNRVQLAPTVQATYSNYTRIHGGAKTHYLSYFTGAREPKEMSDSLQSEQGTRFAGKFNRNSVQCVAELLAPKTDLYKWTTSAEMKQALLTDYCVNTDARSVIVTAPWQLIASEDGPFAGYDDPGSFRAHCRCSYQATVEMDFVQRAATLLEQARSKFDLKVTQCSLNDLPNWKIHDKGIEELKPNAGFAVRYYAVEAPERETAAWAQPLLQSDELGEVLLLAQIRDGLLKIFLSLSYEIGLTGGIEYGPSYLSETSSTHMGEMKTFLETAAYENQLTVLQSDEGGRFMKSRARYSVAFLAESEETTEQCSGIWVTLAELEQLCREPKLLTNEARSCVSLLLGIS